MHTTHHVLRRAFHSFRSLSSQMARAMTRAIPSSLKSTFSKSRFLSFSPPHPTPKPLKPSPISGTWLGNGFSKVGGWGVLRASRMGVFCGRNGGFGDGERGYRRSRKKFMKSKKKAKELELSVKILIEEGLPNDPEFLRGSRKRKWDVICEGLRGALLKSYD